MHFLLLFVILTFPLSFSVYAQETIRIANGKWHPYQGQELEGHGFVTQIVKQAFELEGLSVDSAFLPWKRSYELARRGKFAATFMWRYTEERAKDFLFSDVLVTSKAAMFHQDSLSLDWQNNDSLAGYVVGGSLGYYYGYDGHPGVQMEWVESDLVNFKKLVHGRIDMFAVDQRVGYHILHTRFRPDQIERITHTPGPGEALAYHLLISREAHNAAGILRRFNRGLRKVRESGRYDEIVAAATQGEYGLHHYAQPH